jgi:hypothetical protein
MASPALRFVTFLAPEMFDVYQEMVGYVGRVLGVRTELFVGAHSYDVFRQDEADFGFI